MTNPQNVDELKQLLNVHGVHYQTWPYKTPWQLWRELELRECSLALRIVRKTLGVAVITVRQASRILFELKEERADGSSQEVNRKPSEKMLPGESWQDTAVRGLCEELNLKQPSCVHLLPDTYVQAQEIEDSRSYPGIITVYPMHCVEARIGGLPLHDFSTVEHAPDEGPVTHYWTWKHEERSS